jgi:UDP-glucose 4-epimerase
MGKRTMKKVIVTGGAGFIGSHVIEALLERGYRVVALDNLSTGRMSNVRRLIDEGKIEFIKGSILNMALLRKTFTGALYIFHEAAIPSVPRSVKNPRASHNANVNGTLNVLLAAKDSGVKKVVYASSSSVYGDTPVLPKVETMNPLPLSPYAVTKLVGEYYCRVFQDIYGLQTACLRYFNVFGPRQDPNSTYAAVIPLFINKVLKGEPPEIFGDGEQTRDFTFVRDVAAANILAAESDATGIFNIGGGKRVTINYLAGYIAKLLGNNTLRPVYGPKREGDVLHSLADISRAKAFNYRPRFSLEEGLQQTVNFFKAGKD